MTTTEKAKIAEIQALPKDKRATLENVNFLLSVVNDPKTASDSIPRYENPTYQMLVDLIRDQSYRVTFVKYAYYACLLAVFPIMLLTVQFFGMYWPALAMFLYMAWRTRVFKKPIWTKNNLFLVLQCLVFAMLWPVAIFIVYPQEIQLLFIRTKLIRRDAK